jgi:hypothetical protein
MKKANAIIMITKNTFTTGEEDLLLVFSLRAIRFVRSA